MNGPDGEATKPDDDVEPLAPALEEWFEKEFAELPLELQERITRDRGAAMLALLWDGTTSGRRRSMAQQRDSESNPANKDEQDFSWGVNARYCELELKERELALVPVVAVAARNHEQRLIDGERIALQRDQAEVESADPGERRATIERVRRRWKERALRSAGMSIVEQTPEALATCFVVPVVAEKPGTDAGKATEDQCGKAPSDVLAEEIIPEIVVEKPPTGTGKTTKEGAPPRGRSFKSDKPLVVEIAEGVKSGRWRLWHGATELAPRAEGSDHGDSKVQRLYRAAKTLLISQGWTGSDSTDSTDSS